MQTRGGLVWEGSGECSANCLHIRPAHPNWISTDLVQTRNLTGVINELSGTVDINCSTSGGTVSCRFLQATIKNVFGNTGLEMNGCIFGECVRQSVIDFLTSDGNNSTNTSSEGTHLSGGVIAGLAIVGGLVFLVGHPENLWL